ncbi:TetR/AcrR family transcriptional regulator, partial [Enterococcus faecalis]|nr:TetR/AcrR family transcriptional regulator [Enterococcus faecalis]
TLLFIDNIITIYIYSYFNVFYRKKIFLYLSLYQQDRESIEFEEDLMKYLKLLVKKRLLEIE